MTDEETIGNVLIVDDQETNIALLAGILEAQGFRTMEAQDGFSALKAIESSRPDVILLDILMPDMDGYEVCRRIKSDERWRDIPILMLTALNSPDDYVRGIESGTDDFMTKPVDASVLIARVKSYLRSKRLADEVRRLATLKSDLTRMIIHDINGPMFGVLGYLEMLSRSSDLPDRAVRQIEAARRSADDAQRMIRNLLQIDQMESGALELALEDCDVHDLVQSGARSLQPVWEARNISMRFEGPQHGVWTQVDRGLAERIIQNLVGNAVKYTDDGGEVIVSWTFENHSGVTLSVTNAGPVIPEEDFQRIFDKFAQIDDRPSVTRMGCGLGLAFCRMAVEAHGGAIDVASPPPGRANGACFSVRLPMKPTPDCQS